MTTMDEVFFRSRQVELSVLPGLGARLHRLRVNGNDLLRTPLDVMEHSRDPFYWGAYVMAPWCNRLAPGRFPIDGVTVDLPANFADGSAIHGQVYAAPWERISDATFAIEREGHGWPWRYRVEQTIEVDESRVTIGQRLTNLDRRPMPGGIGIHPWLPGHVRLSINSGLVYPSNSDSAAAPVAVAGDLDLRLPSEMAVGVDATWSEVAEPQVELWWPEHGLHGVMRAYTLTPHIVAANAPERAAIAVEPQTHAPQGLRRLVNGESGALAMLASGETLTLTTVLAFDSYAAPVEEAPV